MIVVLDELIILIIEHQQVIFNQEFHTSRRDRIQYLFKRRGKKWNKLFILGIFDVIRENN